jgi:AcrR family transcriptional regulator
MTVAARREQEREARRECILDAAEQVFGTKGLDLATMGDIARQAELGKGTLYLYFETKEALLVGIAVRRQRSLIARYDAIADEDRSGIDRLRELMAAWADHMARSRQHLRMVMARWVSATPFESAPGSEFEANVRHVFGTVCDAVARAQAEGSVRGDVEPARLAVHLWASINGALLTTLKLSCLPASSPITQHALSIDEHIELALDGLVTRRVSGTGKRERAGAGT